MYNYVSVDVGDLLVLPACNTKAYFTVTSISKIEDPLMWLATVVDVYGNSITLDLVYANCRKANFIDRIQHWLKKRSIKKRKWP